MQFGFLPSWERHAATTKTGNVLVSRVMQIFIVFMPPGAIELYLVGVASTQEEARTGHCSVEALRRYENTPVDNNIKLWQAFLHPNKYIYYGLLFY